MSNPSPARLAALSSKTLTLAMERQRLLSLSPPSGSPLRPGTASSTGSVAQITRNLRTLRDGIVNLETSNGSSKETTTLRDQYKSVLDILGEEDSAAHDLEALPPPPQRKAAPLIPVTPSQRPDSPYRDNPQVSDHGLILEQRQTMEEQDTRLDSLSQSIGRQHHISLQINDELEEHTGLLDSLDVDMDRTDNRLQAARRTLDKVSKGARDNCSTMTIAIIILILLLLIIVFKT